MLKKKQIKLLFVLIGFMVALTGCESCGDNDDMLLQNTPKWLKDKEVSYTLKGCPLVDVAGDALAPVEKCGDDMNINPSVLPKNLIKKGEITFDFHKDTLVTKGDKQMWTISKIVEITGVVNINSVSGCWGTWPNGVYKPNILDDPTDPCNQVNGLDKSGKNLWEKEEVTSWIYKLPYHSFRDKTLEELVKERAYVDITGQKYSLELDHIKDNLSGDVYTIDFFFVPTSDDRVQKENEGSKGRSKNNLSGRLGKTIYRMEFKYNTDGTIAFKPQWTVDEERAEGCFKGKYSKEEDCPPRTNWQTVYGGARTAGHGRSSKIGISGMSIITPKEWDPTKFIPTERMGQHFFFISSK